MPSLALALGMVSALAASSAAAQTPARDADNPTCPSFDGMPNFPEKMEFRLKVVGTQRIVNLNGGVTQGDAERLDAFIRSSGVVDEVWLNSQGGNAAEGPRIGQVIRNWGIPTRVPAGYWCVSACTLAFLGGPIRTVDENGVYAVHMFTIVNSEGAVKEESKQIDAEGEFGLARIIKEQEEQSAQMASEWTRYMMSMGVSTGLANIMFHQQAAMSYVDPKTKKRYAFGADRSRVTCLSRKQLHDTNVDNAN